MRMRSRDAEHPMTPHNPVVIEAQADARKPLLPLNAHAEAEKRGACQASIENERVPDHSKASPEAVGREPRRHCHLGTRAHYFEALHIPLVAKVAKPQLRALPHVFQLHTREQPQRRRSLLT